MTNENNEQAKPQRLHRATYSRDGRNGGYLVRVAGPTANRFAGRTVPVERLDKSENQEELKDLIWAGIDTGEYGGKAGEPVALYSFVQKPRADDDVLPF